MASQRMPALNRSQSSLMVLLMMPSRVFLFSREDDWGQARWRLVGSSHKLRSIVRSVACRITAGKEYRIRSLQNQTRHEISEESNIKAEVCKSGKLQI